MGISRSGISTGITKDDLRNQYMQGYIDGTRKTSANIKLKLKQDIENGVIKIEYGCDKLFEILNYYIDICECKEGE